MAPKRKATKTAVAAEIETEQAAVISQVSTEKKIKTKKPNETITSKKDAKPENEVANDDNVDISPKRGNQRPRRENAKKVVNYVEQKIEPAKKKSRGKKTTAKLVTANENSENDKHVANNSTQADGNSKKRTKKSAIKDDVPAVDKGIVEEKPKKAKSTKSKKEEIEATPEKKSVKSRKAVKKEEKVDVVVKSSPAKKKVVKKNGRMSIGTPTPRDKQPFIESSNKESEQKSNDDTTDTSQNLSSDEEHKPKKVEPVLKKRKRAAEAAKPKDAAVTKRNKNEKATAEDKVKPKQKMNSTTTDYTKIDFDSDKEHTLKICSWNVAGLRAIAAKDGFEYFEHEKPDIVCLQEIKCLEEEVPAEATLPGYHMYYCSKPGGRGGVALYSKKMPYNIENDIGDDEMDEEGRIITAEYSKFYLVCVYVPNAGRKLVNLERRLRWNKMFEQHVNKLKAIKPVVIVGDMNVAHNEIDLANPKTNTKNAGFSIEERTGMDSLLNSGYIDTFRHLYPDRKNAYTFWTYMGGARAKNVGWRLDYGIVSENLASKVVDNIIRSEVLGSDHCPMLLLLNL